MNAGLCPKCGGEADMGYGLAGGGIGSYTYCLRCDYFQKFPEDPQLQQEQETTTMATKPYESPDDVRKALSNDIIDGDEAKVILVDQFEWAEDEATAAVTKWESEEAAVDDSDDEDDDEADEPA
jgi:hypothetical protein